MRPAEQGGISIWGRCACRKFHPPRTQWRSSTSAPGCASRRSEAPSTVLPPSNLSFPKTHPATMARAPPGRRSRAIVVNRWPKRMNKSFLAAETRARWRPDQAERNPFFAAVNWNSPGTATSRSPLPPNEAQLARCNSRSFFEHRADLRSSQAFDTESFRSSRSSPRPWASAPPWGCCVR
jgi:hypothetical protein